MEKKEGVAFMAIVLHRDAVTDELYQVLQKLMREEKLKDFYLVGGTALALYFGHRRSVDIDLFTSKPFDSQKLVSYLEKAYDMQQSLHEENTVRGFIDGIKVEFILHDYRLLGEVEQIDSLRLASIKDLVAMKLNAIAGRGSKKDFWDISALFTDFSLQEMISIFCQKYPAADVWHLYKSCGYFDDAEREAIEINDLQGKKWEDVKERVVKELETLDI